MNNFKTSDNGGLPFVLDDLRWIDAGYREAFKGMMSAYGVTDSTAVIISGCIRTVASGTVTITEGFISLGGEICFVPLHTYPVPTAGQVEYFDLVVAYDPLGNKPFQSTTNFDTYEQRGAMIAVASALPSGYTLYGNVQSVFQVTRAWLGLIAATPWVNVPSCSNAFPGPYGQGKYMIDTNGFVHLKGAFTNEDPGTLTVVGLLPVGFRPPEPQFSRLSNGSGGVFELQVKMDGTIYVGTGCPQVVYLNQIPAFKV